MNQWYLVKVKYTKQGEDGSLKRVTEGYLINAMSFTEAESRIYSEVFEYVRGECSVESIAKQNYADVFHYDDSTDWHEASVNYVSEDADSGREVKVTNKFLVSADNVKQAYDRIEESLRGLMVSYETPVIKKTKIIEIFPYVAMEGEELVKPDAYAEEGKDAGTGVNVAYVAPEEEEE